MERAMGKVALRSHEVKPVRDKHEECADANDGIGDTNQDKSPENLANLAAEVVHLGGKDDQSKRTKDHWKLNMQNVTYIYVYIMKDGKCFIYSLTENVIFIYEMKDGKCFICGLI